MEKIDLLDVAATLSNTAKQLLNGEELQEVTLKIEVTIPQYLWATAKSLSPLMNMTPEQVLSAIVSETLKQDLDQSVKMTQQIAQAVQTQNQPVAPKQNPSNEIAQVAELFKNLGLDMSGVTESFKKLDDMAVQLQSLKKTSENAYGSLSTQGQNNQDNQKPILPTGRVVREGSKS